jgi:hypothetical protein
MGRMISAERMRASLMASCIKGRIAFISCSHRTLARGGEDGLLPNSIHAYDYEYYCDSVDVVIGVAHPAIGVLHCGYLG